MDARWKALAAGHAWIMGVLNCTPDSFSDGGLYVDTASRLEHALQMTAQGAAIVDVGGESTRPGSQPVPVDEELLRVIPVVEALADHGVVVSIDTCKPEVMRAAIQAGARMVNDVNALLADGALDAVAGSDADICLMHMRGTPQTMQHAVHYNDVVDEVISFLESRAKACIAAGIAAHRILLDPGIGFGKRLQDNLDLIAAIPRLRELGFPVLMGVSRKSFLGELSGSSVADREIETASAVTACVLLGADVLRVHDVAAQKRAIGVASALALASSNQAVRLA
ncbi:MAG: dihydropteroate synthase [Zetaproteobacteria bacterium CG06_land_8_20_14_3_00_59_53]|nr:MAG: dihydropteroate synthase [Zetaproteobacteria bacterium CG2_30_59_37]PIO90867.1 MAG: dihydropteroate synthase [Zetaproteobacteria bacterium CG23_combo_of_CG06-09_8_20_14_all_59_86]PIQ64658.1 MAG: dihydropteroate synthase [Zetaproteobacteria bacterium CG11_big_fil_rev_8_21_14_0_20_59_439]PIU71177.1 MAG: dihydropteroate synthase [Zetaproteobacteria bacterium CG06_land_8_20_14_3_00_59_53]PIU96670.1 MAG: dihydropteroate synthase [Zetaproteobacteria bacterium CG03_land_8_20_14_0_80_59_51]PIY